MSDEPQLTTADMLEIYASGGNGAEYVDGVGLILNAAAELRTTQARFAEAVEWIREARKFCQDGLAGDGCTPQQALERIHEASGDILAKLEGRLKELPVSMSDEEILTSLFGAKVERALPTDDEALVEKVAMAIWDERCKHWGKYRKHLHEPNSEGYDWDDLSLSKRKELTREALAAIRAMEEKP